jgi:ATP-binding cassette subfamily B protein
VDIKKYKRRHLRENVGVVLQEPFLYSRTIAENIAGLSKDAPIERTHAAAAIAQVDSDIGRFARGYDTIVGERGVTLSGGQKQRVAIARAVLRDTPIMIFDDSLSAVDTETDARIRAALKERVRGVTAIIISHRVTTISDADLIIVMEDGRIAEMGTPSELMKRGGIYARVTDMQNLGAPPQTPQEASPLTPFKFYCFHPKGEDNKIKRVQGACSLPGLGAEPRGAEDMP